MIVRNCVLKVQTPLHKVFLKTLHIDGRKLPNDVDDDITVNYSIQVQKFLTISMPTIKALVILQSDQLQCDKFSYNKLLFT